MQVVFQFLMVGCSVAAIGMIVGKRRAGRLSLNAMIFWSLFWCAVAVVAVYPESASRVASFFGIGRGVDVLVYTSILVLFFLIFKLHVTLEAIRRDMTAIVRKDAVREPQLPEQSDSRS